MGIRKGLARTVLAAFVVLLGPATADAAEVVQAETGGIAGEVVVERGESARFVWEVSATGDLSCSTSRGDNSAVRVNRQFTVSGGGVSQSSPSELLRFYADAEGRLPFESCPVDADRKPYLVDAQVTAAPDAAIREYRVRVPLAELRNPPVSQVVGPQLMDEAETEMVFRVKVTEPNASEQRKTFKLKPVSGQVFGRYPGGALFRVTEPLTVLANISVNALNGRVEVVSDGNGLELQQTMEFRLGSFKVLPYSRLRQPGLPQRTSRPITELRVLGSVPRSCTGGHAQSARHRRSRRRRLWGRGRGRYRTRGRYGAATARGTHFFFERSCRGDLLRVFEGVMAFRDYGVKKTFRVAAGRSYLAAPPGSTNVAG